MSNVDDVVARTVELLWPGPAGERCYRALPSVSRPRFLVPERPRRAAAAGLHAVRESHSRQARWRTALAGAVVASAPTALLPGDRVSVGDGGIDDRLSEVVGHPVVPTVHLGPPRANRKPVLALTSPQGAVLGFAKLGADPLTSTLVACETRALTELSTVDHPAFRVPQLLSAGSWQGRPFVVQSPLPLDRADEGAVDRRLVVAQVQLARAFGTSTSPAGHSPYVLELLDRLGGTGATGRALAAALVDDPALGTTDVELGAWHGDWRATNFALTADDVLVWDWERFATGVPVGYDALHHWLMSRAPRDVDLHTRAAALQAHAPHLLAPFGLGPAQADLTTTLYLAELGARYLVDRQAETSARLGDVAAWILPYLQQRAGVPGG